MAGTDQINVNTGDSSGIVVGQNTGNFTATVNNYSTREPERIKSYSWSMIRPVASYVERPELLQQLRDHLLPWQVANNEGEDGEGPAESKASVSQDARIVVLYGLGGAGKTQLALRYRQKYLSEYDATFWIDCTTEQSIQRDFLQIYASLSSDFSQHSGTSFEQALYHVKTWFQHRRGKWLFIFDSIDNVGDSEDSTKIDITHYLIEEAGVNSILTSRVALVAQATRNAAIEVYKMTQDEAAQLLRRTGKIKGQGSRDQELVAEIVQELDCLPLAVALAGSYVSETELSSDLKEYLEVYRKHKNKLLKQVPEQHTHFYTKSLLFTWETSYEVLTKETPKAATLLCLMSCLASDDIFSELFFVPNADGFLSEAKECCDDTTRVRILQLFEELDEYSFNECIRQLKRYSFLQKSGYRKSSSIHKLVHSWAYDRMALEEQWVFIKTAFRMISRQWGAAILNSKITFIPHILEVICRLVEFLARPVKMCCGKDLGSSERDKTCSMHSNMSNTLSEVSLFVIKVGKEVQGRCNLPWADVARRFAAAFYSSGKADRYLSIIEDSLRARPGRLECKQIQIHLLNKMGLKEEAYRVSGQILKDFANQLELAPLDTEVAHANLRDRLGKYENVEGITERPEVTSQGVPCQFDDDDERNFRAMQAIQRAHFLAGDYSSAREIGETLVSWSSHRYGERNFITMKVSILLCSCKLIDGRAEEAQVMITRLLGICRSIWGCQHPHTAMAGLVWAMCFFEKGRKKEVLRVLEDVSKCYKRLGVVGRIPYFNAELGISGFLASRGNFDKAKARLRDVLAKMETALEHDHPLLLETKAKLAALMSNKLHQPKDVQSELGALTAALFEQ